MITFPGIIVNHNLQKNSSQAVDLSPYACSTVSISFGVLSKYGKYSGQQLQFSPPTTVCIPGGQPYSNTLNHHYNVYNALAITQMVAYIALNHTLNYKAFKMPWVYITMAIPWVYITMAILPWVYMTLAILLWTYLEYNFHPETSIASMKRLQ